MLIGAHVSTAGGYDKMAQYIELVGAECFQIFSKSPRQWVSKALDPAAIALLEAERTSRNLGPLFTHTAYLINLTTSNDELRAKSVRALADELARGSMLGAAGVNTHLGNVPDGDVDEAISRAAQAIDEAFDLAAESGPVRTRLVLENTAGAGTTFGGPISDLAEVIARCKTPREQLGICVDTCHGWSFGYDVSSAQGWAELVGEIEDTCGLDMWLLVHANDCNYERGSKKDRHEWIGDGLIGSEGFRAMLALPGTDHICICTEMPGEPPEKDIVNIERLKALRDSR